MNELHPNNIKVWNFVPSDMLKHVNSNIGEQDTSYSVDAEKTYRANATVQLIIKKKKHKKKKKQLYSILWVNL